MTTLDAREHTLVAAAASAAAGDGGRPVRAPRSSRRLAGYASRVASRVGQAVLVLWATYTVTFIVLFALPSDAVELILTREDPSGGLAAGLSGQSLEELRAQYGLDQPMLSQYFVLLGNALRLDFGTSILMNQPVTELILQNLPPTLALAGLGLGFAIVAGVLLALVASYAHATWLRTFLTRLPAAGVALPGFFVGLLLVQVFAFGLKWFPASGSGTFAQLILPAVTIAIPTSALIAQVLIKSLDSTLREPYIQTARAKGLTDFAVLVRHAFKNASFPALTLIGILVGSAVTGAIVTETVFSRQGVGRLVQTAVMGQDIPLVQGIVVLSAGAFVAVSLLVDLLYPLLDPRLRRQGT